MSHVDEGLLHAWIDGAFEPGDPEGAAIEAHLEACAECRTSAEAAMQLKDRAAQVLRHAEPDAVRVEPFDRMIRARTANRAGAAGGGDAVSPGGAAAMRPRRRMQIPLAWAASIMVAVTAGWFANTMLRPDRSSGPQEAAFEPLSVQAPSSETRGESERQERSEADAAVADAAAMQAAEAVQAPQRRAAEAAGAAGGERREAATLGRTVPAAAPPPVELKTAGAAVRESIAATVAEAEQVAASEDRLLESTVSGEWSPLTLAEATRRFGRAPFALEGIPIESIEVAENGTALSLRVRQRIDADATVEIVQRPAAIALDEVVVTGLRDDTASARVRALAAQANRAASRPANEPLDLMQRGDTPAVRVPIIGYTVLIRGSLPADSLRALAARIR